MCLVSLSDAPHKSLLTVSATKRGRESVGNAFLHKVTQDGTCYLKKSGDNNSAANGNVVQSCTWPFFLQLVYCQQLPLISASRCFHQVTDTLAWLLEDIAAYLSPYISLTLLYNLSPSYKNKGRIKTTTKKVGFKMQSKQSRCFFFSENSEHSSIFTNVWKSRSVVCLPDLERRIKGVL